ncbi:hypothetical protein [Bartonella tamiae]|uniref:Uncharacterized protein n=1 Tax=Bartonella tamiae Th239 TaxID=1094558 RepID=J0QX70_9HYPH|nr:hypothetical protein [Bartonella tamiae]EJF90641.1 hypothetical protein ME5_01042 [Bartonella tamiae Th239]EJF93982.1 hypothetical protein MEG_00840 [Bartonella tamiae Th307]
MKHSPTDLAALIAEEQKLAAIEYQTEAWVGGLANGIKPEILAEAALDTALRHLLRNRNEKQALELLSLMRDKVIQGDFIDNKSIQ